MDGVKEFNRGIHKFIEGKCIRILFFDNFSYKSLKILFLIYFTKVEKDF